MRGMKRDQLGQWEGCEIVGVDDQERSVRVDKKRISPLPSNLGS